MNFIKKRLLIRSLRLFIKEDWIKFIVPALLFGFTTYANFVEAARFSQDVESASPIDPATKTFILGEIDPYTPIIEERRDVDRIQILEEGEDFTIRKPTLVATEFTEIEEIKKQENRTETVTHVVQSGETLSAIGMIYSLKQKTILAANQSLKDADSLAIGDKLIIPAEDYSSDYADKLIAKKEAKFSRAIATKTTTGKIALTKGASTVAPASSCIRPVNYQYISRRISAFHKGVDMIAPTGTAIYASCSGSIAAIAGGWSGGFGIHVKVRQDNGDETIYAHMSSVSDSLSVGASVAPGTYLGNVGSTGRSTGPHLHLEVRRGGRAIDYGF